MPTEDIYNEFPNRLQSGSVGQDLNSADIKVALLTSSHTPAPESNASWADVSANEASGTGYTAGGQTISNFSVTADSGNRLVTADGDDVEWTNSTIDASYAVVYNASPSTDSNKDLIMLIDFGGQESSENASFTIQWDSNGIYEFDTNPA